TNSGTSWVPSGAKVSLNASADTGYHFVGWSGTGNSSVTAATTEINVTLTSPDAEYATFAPNATPVYVVTVEATGLTAGGTYSVMFNGTTYSGSGTFALPAYLGGDYTISVPIAYDNTSSLVRFWPESFTSTLGTGPGGTYNLDANGGMINIVFATQYALQVSTSVGGTVNPTTGTYWETDGNQTTLTATPTAGYIFDGWSGTGAGSMNATTEVLTVTTNSPIAEAALFSTFIPPLPATYVLTVTETGLPSGTDWTFSDGVTGTASTSGSAVLSGLNGTFTVTVPVVRIGSGDQYLPSTPSQPVTLTSQNQSVNIAFSGQYLLTVVAGAGGTASPGTGWVAQGSSVSLMATPNTGYSFAGWVGTGGGNYTGSTATGSVTMSSVITETAQFTQNSASTVGPVTAQTNGAPLPAYLPWVALAALLVVGLLAGYLISRKGSSSSPPPPPPSDAAAAPVGAMAGGAPEMGTDAPESPPAEYDESR
ncbi:MAG: hypothetical protein L3K03_08725, partial [Thermoplasmata archaeon]|nr:hypothetical protein [Thermoplasmata archaeon]